MMFRVWYMRSVRLPMMWFHLAESGVYVGYGLDVGFRLEAR